MSPKLHNFLNVLCIQMASMTGLAALYFANEYLQGRIGLHPFVMGMYFLFAILMPHFLEAPEHDHLTASQ